MTYAIPDDWLAFCEVTAWTPSSSRYPEAPGCKVDVIALLADIEPPRRDPGIPPFKKYKMCPVLFASSSHRSALCRQSWLSLCPMAAPIATGC